MDDAAENTAKVAAAWTAILGIEVMPEAVLRCLLAAYAINGDAEVLRQMHDAVKRA